MSGPLEFFTNKEATEEGKVAVKSPAFSLTKVAGGLGTLIAAIAVAATKLEGATAVKVAAIGAGALVMVGYFGLAAVDLIVRQRMSEAKLRWPATAADAKDAAKPKDPSPNGGTFVVVADTDDLVLQERHNGDEYELRYAEIEGDKVTLVARRDGKTLAPSFHRP